MNNDVIISHFFGFLFGFIYDAQCHRFFKTDYVLASDLPDDWQLWMGRAKKISDLPEPLQKIAEQSIPYFLKECPYYTETDIPR